MLYNEETEQKKSAETDYVLDFIGYSQKTLNYGLYTKLNEFESHLETISTKYKQIALTWLLATFAGIGFLLSVQTAQLPVNHLVAVSLIAMIGLLGVTLLWHLDVNIYNLFWTAVFIEEIRMEKKLDFVCQTRSLMLLIDEDREKIFHHGLFYIIANSLLVCTIAAAMFYLFRNLDLIYIVFVAIAFVLFEIGMYYFMTSYARKMESAFNKLIKEK